MGRQVHLSTGLTGSQDTCHFGCPSCPPTPGQCGPALLVTTPYIIQVWGQHPVLCSCSPFLGVDSPSPFPLKKNPQGFLSPQATSQRASSCQDLAGRGPLGLRDHPLPPSHESRTCTQPCSGKDCRGQHSPDTSAHVTSFLSHSVSVASVTSSVKWQQGLRAQTGSGLGECPAPTPPQAASSWAEF